MTTPAFTLDVPASFAAAHGWASWKVSRFKGGRKWVCWGMGAWVTYRKDEPLHVGLGGKYLGVWTMTPEAARAKLERQKAGAHSLHRDGSARWKSKATWPDGETTSDDHDTEAQARAVCQMLKRDGMGGLQEVFPTKTWVVAPNAPDQQQPT